MDAISSSKGGQVIGNFTKDKFTNEFIAEWQKVFSTKSFEQVDISNQIAYLTAPKDDNEIEITRKACGVTVDVYTKYLREEITEIVDADKKVRHSKLVEGIEKATNDRKYVKGVDPNQVDICYTPIIQSGGNYSLKFSAQRYF